MPKLLDKFKRNSDVDEEEILKQSIAGYPHLVAMKPKERYMFHSDYWEADEYVATILSFIHSDEAQERLQPFWGVMRMPMGLEKKGSFSEDVTVSVIEQTHRMDDAWIETREARADRLDKMTEQEQKEAGNRSSQKKADKIALDFDQIITELRSGDSYLNVHMRLFVKAPNLEVLDRTVEAIGRQYIAPLPTVTLAPYHGEQRFELSNLWKKNEKKHGKGFYFTSSEYAGAYSLVTNGLNDPQGEYVGSMVGDFNNAANLLDVDDYVSHVAIAHPSRIRELNNSHVSDIWGSKLSQAALINNYRVVHIILDPSVDLDKLGPKMNSLTYKVDLNHGDINMFEVFGDRKDALSLFDQQKQKILLMAEQLYTADGTAKSIIRGELSGILNDFYIDMRMWAENAPTKENRLRLVGIPHEQVPTLQDFILYLDQAYEASKNNRHSAMADNNKLLASTFKGLLESSGDLFNRKTSPNVDGAKSGQRVIYDFSQLMVRGKGVAMAQLVNVVGFAVSSLGEGDLVIIHGTENIVNSHDITGDELEKNSVKQYLDTQFEHLRRRGGRVAYLYNDIDEMLADQAFNKFDEADYTILGSMTDNGIARYEEALGQSIPPALKTLVKNRVHSYCYFRRGVDNVVFQMDLRLGIDPNWDYKRRRAGENANISQLKAENVVSETQVTSAEETEIKKRKRVPVRRKSLSKSGATKTSSDQVKQKSLSRKEKA